MRWADVKALGRKVRDPSGTIFANSISNSESTSYQLCDSRLYRRAKALEISFYLGHGTMTLEIEECLEASVGLAGKAAAGSRVCITG